MLSCVLELHRLNADLPFFFFFFALSFFYVGCCEFVPLSWLHQLVRCSVSQTHPVSFHHGNVMLTLLCTDVTEHSPPPQKNLIAPDLCCPPTNHWRLQPLFNQLEVAVLGPVVV